MSHGDRQGWFADPFRLHEQRYFSGGLPTKLVRDGTVEGYDEPPAGTSDPTAVEFWSGDAISDQAAAEGVDYPRPRRRRGPGFSTWYAITVVAVAAAVALVIVGLRHR